MLKKNGYFIRTAAAVMASAILLSGCNKINADETLVTIEAGEDTITLGYGNFVARYTQATYDQYYRAYFGDSYWDTDMSGEGSTMLESTKETLMESIETQYLCKLHAEEYDVALTDEQTADIEAAAKAFMEDNSDEAIEEMGATEDYVKEMLEYETYEKRVSDAVKETAEIEITDDEVNQTTFSYVFFDTSATTDDSGVTTEKTDEEKEAAKISAEAVAEADDFDEAMSGNGQADQSTSFTTSDDDETVAGDTGLDEAVIAAVRELSDGEVSDVIEVEDTGYYVVRLDKALDEEATAEKRESLDTEKRQEAYDDILEEWKAKIGWVVDEKAWKKVKFDTLFEIKAEEETTDEEETDEDVTEETTDDTTDEEATEESDDSGEED